MKNFTEDPGNRKTSDFWLRWPQPGTYQFTKDWELKNKMFTGRGLRTEKRERLTKSVIQTVQEDKEPSASAMPMSKSLNSDNLKGKEKKVKFLTTAEVVGIDKISDKKISPEKLSQSVLSLPSSKSRGSSSSKLFSKTLKTKDAVLVQICFFKTLPQF